MRTRIVFSPSFLAILALLSSAAQATPAEVLILRHAEKPGDDSIPHLSAQGYERAAKLPGLFAHDPRFEGPINAIFATSPKHSGKSIRAEETVTPLSEAVNLPIEDANAYGGMDGLAQAILQDPDLDGRRVVVCLVHETIVDFAQSLGAEEAPAKWPKESFDRIWDIHFNGRQVTFDDLPQHLLPGDDDR